MLYLISAPPRTGKSLYMIKLIIDKLNEGRPVYTNILGINIDGVRTFTSTPDDLFDWRDLPNGSVIFYDEAQEHLAFGNKKIPKKYADRADEILDIGDSLSLHGHFGFDIYFATQKPQLLRSDILGFVSVHYILRRKFGANFCTIWEFGEAITTWSKSTADSALVKTHWKYPKYLYKYYTSSESHTVKLTLPKKYLAFLAIPIFLLVTAYVKANEGGFFGLFGNKEQTTEQQKEQIQLDQQPDQEQGYTVKKVPSGADVDEELLRLQAESMGITLEQLKDLQNPEIKNLEHEQRSAEYNINNPFDYSYLKAGDRTFSGCIGNQKTGYKAYDTNGIQITDIDSSVCTKVMAGQRPHNPGTTQDEFKMASQGNFNSINQADYQQDNPKMTPEQYAKYLQYLDEHSIKNDVQPHLQPQFHANSQSSFSF